MTLARQVTVLFLAAASLAFGAGRGFRSQHLLDEHYAKYGQAFGRITREQYLHMAQQLRDSKNPKTTVETRRPDGSGAKFDRKRGWFVAYEPDGTLKTFFVPKDGFRYFQWQASQAPSTGPLPDQ